MTELFGTNDLPPMGSFDDLLAPTEQQPYQDEYGQQYNMPAAQGEHQFTQQAYDPALFDQQQQQPYQQGYSQQYESGFPGGDQQYTQSVYDSPFGTQQESAPEFYGQHSYPPPPQQQRQYGQQNFSTYQTPVGNGEMQTPKKAPKKAAKKRVPRKAPKKSGEDDFRVSKKAPKKASKKASKKAFREPTPDSEDEVVPVSYRSHRNMVKKSMKEPSPLREEDDEDDDEDDEDVVPTNRRVSRKAPKKTVKEPTPPVEDEAEKAAVPIDPRISRKAPKKTVKAPSPGPSSIDYSPITTLLLSPTAACTSPTKKYFTFLTDHLDFVILRFATVCVGLCRLDKADDAESLAQFAIDFFSKEMWLLAVDHYVNISQDGDELEMMKPCMADCIGTFKEFHSEDVAQELQDAVSLNLPSCLTLRFFWLTYLSGCVEWIVVPAASGFGLI